MLTKVDEWVCFEICYDIDRSKYYDEKQHIITLITAFWHVNMIQETVLLFSIKMKVHENAWKCMKNFKTQLNDI